MHHMMQFVATDPKLLNRETLDESWWVIKTRNDVSFSQAHYDCNLGIYFQPRIGTGGPVILLDDVTELHRVLEA